MVLHATRTESPGGLLATLLVLGCLSSFAVIESAIIAEALHGHTGLFRASVIRGVPRSRNSCRDDVDLL